VQVGRRIGMVFQKPTPFLFFCSTMSIEDNVPAGLTLNGVNISRADAIQVIERSRARRRLGEVKDRVRRPVASLSADSSRVSASRARSRFSPRCY